MTSTARVVVFVAVMLVACVAPATLGPGFAQDRSDAEGAATTTVVLSIDGGDTPAETTLRVVNERLAAAKAGVAELAPAAGGKHRITCRMAEGIDRRDASGIADWLVTRGELEFVICASKEITRREKALRAQLKDWYRPPARLFEWLPHMYYPDEYSVLVRRPLRPYERALADAVAAKADEAAVAGLEKKLERLRSREVFDGADLASARRVTVSPAQEVVVFFEMSDARAQPFKDFTRRHVGEQLAVVIDGRVLTAPTIRSALPGEGIIGGGLAMGFTTPEADILAHILDTQQLLDAHLSVESIDTE